MSFLNKLFSFFHGGNSASDTSTDPAYAYLPENVHHEEEMIASVTDTTDVGWSNTDSFSTSIFDDSFSSSSFDSGFDS